MTKLFQTSRTLIVKSFAMSILNLPSNFPTLPLLQLNVDVLALVVCSFLTSLIVLMLRTPIPN